MRIHILGISGTFMAGVAILAKQLGHKVSGSDKNIYEPMKSVLLKEKIKVIKNYNPKVLEQNIDLIIVGNVMTRGMPIIEKLLESNIKFISGPQWLRENILINKKVIAVAGTHGKTTTSSMITWILKYLKIKPSYLIGGLPQNLDAPAKLENSNYFVIEADEYDTAFFDKRSKFIHYKPDILIINNIEFDHADIFQDINSIIKSFHHLVRLIPRSGSIIYDSSDTNIKKLLKLGNWSKLIPLGFKKNKNIKWNLLENNKKYFLNKKEISMNSIGLHNFKNASFSIIAASLLKVPLSKSLDAMKNFSGVKRRMEKVGNIKYLNSPIDIFDDFAHHPTEIKYSIKSLKEKFKGKKLLSICEVKSNSMLQGIHKKELYKSLQMSDLSLVFSNKKIEWKFEKRKGSKITMTDSFSMINKYIKKNIKNIDLILIMSNADTKNIIKSIKT
ncbi:MAG: UDP-N-acetylmuramate:L-alanyl-gamma-D-glutamyl-meso-diaminopimelate ligase [Pseudomonadota bacterium]|nr:UDP-N-acetylmuramate:L-alanyl-gamma-D-glutamyl-meso-diaminopimelate ligase [Pseudomonadota bacterium]